MSTTTLADQQIQQLQEWFGSIDSCLIAFSGGIDSSLVALLARRFLGQEKCLAVIGDSASLKRKDLMDARAFAGQYDIPLQILHTQEMDDPCYRSNPTDRCFHCKSELYTKLEEVRREKGFECIVGGENADDRNDYRPGLRAVEKFEIRSPLAECSITKEELRKIALHLELECWEKPASPCLSSRIPYFQEITPVKLQQIEAGESLLDEKGFPVCRVRHMGTLAWIEVPRERIADLAAMESQLIDDFRNLGFKDIQIDPEGFVSGKMNRAIS